MPLRGGDPVALIHKALPLLRSVDPPDRTSTGATDLAALLTYAGHRGSAYRGLRPRCRRAYLAGDDVPLFRLLSEASTGRFGSDSASTTIPTGCSSQRHAPTNPNRSISVRISRCRNVSFQRGLREGSCVQRTHVPALHARRSATANRRAVPRMAGANYCATGIAPRDLPQRSDPCARRRAGLPSPRRQWRGPLRMSSGTVDTSKCRSSHIAARNDSSGCVAKIAATFIASNTTDASCLSHLERPPSRPTPFRKRLRSRRRIRSDQCARGSRPLGRRPADGCNGTRCDSTCCGAGVARPLRPARDSEAEASLRFRRWSKVSIGCAWTRFVGPATQPLRERSKHRTSPTR